MGNLKRYKKGERWRLVGEGRELGPGDKVELKVGNHWILTEIEWNRTTNDFRTKTMGLYMYDGQPARLPNSN